jgi:hypothetical protein
VTDCWTCGQEDHLSRECPNVSHAHASGALQPYTRAGTLIEHMQRIEGYVDLWTDGKLSTRQKRQAIAGENLQWYGKPTTRNGVCLTTA